MRSLLLLGCLGLLLFDAGDGRAAGTVIAWGNNQYGQTNIPPDLTNAIAVAGGAFHSAALRADGTVVAWGQNSYGQTNVPAGLNDVVAIGAGNRHTLALRQNGTVFAWGSGSFGQTNIPPDLTNAIAIAAARFHNLALRSDSTVVAWGFNSSGQTNVPANLSNVIAVAGGYNHSLALKQDGTVVAWGATNNGQTTVPVGLNGVVAIAAGGNHSLALCSDGSVMAWGDSANGLANIPTSLSNAVAIAAGAFHSLALNANGVAYGWGQNSFSQTNVPPGVQSNVIALAAGDYHNVAITNSPDAPRIIGVSGDTKYSGHTARLRVLASGSNLMYQWQRNGTNISASTNSELVLENVQAGDAGSYTIIVSNALGFAVNSNVFLAVIEASPFIISGPSNVVSDLGARVMFRVEADGSRPLWYQWLFNDVVIGDATNETLVLESAQANQAGEYTVVVSNQFGAVTSSSTTLTLRLLVVPAVENKFVGTAAAFQVQTNGPTPFSYQWRFNSVPIAGATNETLRFDALRLEESGFYSVVASNAFGAITSSVAVLNVTGVATVDGFNPDLGIGIYQPYYNPYVFTLAVQPDGKIPVGGYFTTTSGQPRTNIARLNADGMLDTGFNPANPVPSGSHIFSLAVQADGKILVGGDFTKLGGQSRTNIARLNVDGTLDEGFNPGARGGVNSFVLQDDGKILVGGYFSILAGQTRNGIARLNADGTLDTSFNPGVNGSVLSLAIQSDGKILVGGYFTSVAGVSRTNIARLNANGTLDLAFNPGARGGNSTPSPAVYALAVQSDGNILVGGIFTNLAGYSRNSLGRLNANGTLDQGFNPTYPFTVVSLVPQADGKIWAAGWSSSANYDYSEIVRMNADGTLDPSFKLEANLGDEVSAVAVQADGKVLVGGNYLYLGAQNRRGLGRLNNPTPAIQVLSYDGSTVTWLRAGSSPEAWRATFEYSTNGLTWTNLGGATRIPNGWQMSGVSVPAGGTIRARGYVMGGRYSGSCWFVETMIGAPAISFHPYNASSIAGGTATFNVTAGGTGPLAYQWRLNGTNIVGATNATLTVPNVQLELVGQYDVVVFNALGQVTSSAAQLTVLIPPSVVQFPPATTVVLGSNLTLFVEATGTPPLLYQWRKNGANIPGATNSSYTITNVQVSDGGAYTVVVKNDYGVATTNPMLLIVEVPSQPPGDNFADRVPIGTNTVIGGTNRFATKELPGEPNHGGKRGGKSVWYTWQAPTNGIATFRTRGSDFDTLLGVYTGDTVSNLTTIASDEDLGGFFTSEVQFNAMAGTNYEIAVDGFAGGEGDFIVSWELEATSDQLPVITSQPQSQPVLPGTNVEFSVAAQGTGLTYEWLFNGMTIPSATNALLVRSNVEPVDVGYYSVRVRNSDGREVISLGALMEIVSRSMPLSVDKLEDFYETDVVEAGAGGPPKTLIPSGDLAVGLGNVDYRISSNVRDTTQIHEPNHCDTITSASRWIRVKATKSGVFYADTIGSSINTVLTAYRDTNLTYLSKAQIACDSEGPNSRLWFNAISNKYYLVVVDGANRATGTFRLNWTFGQPPSTATNPQPRQIAHSGDNVLLRAWSTNGIPPPRFQWFWNGRAINGATNATYSLNGLQLTNAGFYTVIVSNALGAVTYGTDVGIEITALQPELRLNDKVLRLWLPTGTNVQSTVEASSDLIHWAPLFPYSPLAPNSFLDLSFTNSSMQFFRTRNGP
jgi:uncharacterized delta-60 repeat protein